MNNTPAHPEKVSVNIGKYFYPPPAGWISVKSVFPKFVGVLVSHLDPCWVRTLFWIHLSTEHKPGIGLRHPSQAVQSRYKIPWSEQLREFCGPQVHSLVKVNYQQPCQLSLGEDLPTGALRPPVEPSISLPWSLRQYQVVVCHQTSYRPHWS